MRSFLLLAIALVAVGLHASGDEGGPEAAPHADTAEALLRTNFIAGPAAMAVLTVAVADRCDEQTPPRVSSLGVWVDGKYEHELLLFPASRRERYDTLLGPFTTGRHTVELRHSAFWSPSGCARAQRADIGVVDSDAGRYLVLQHTPVLELRADTVGEQTDVPLFEYVEDAGEAEARTLRYTVVFSNEDGGTQTRALFARWGRTTDIEQVYEAKLEGGRVIREEFQGPDHETRVFAGRRRGAAPILLVATLNNMVTDRGRGIAAVRPLPDVVDLSRATRESTLDARPWAYSIMARELAAEGHVADTTPIGDRWIRQAPDPREHVYLEARLTLDRALAAAWVRDRHGRRHSSNYERESLAIDRDGWVRTAVAVGPDPGSQIVEAGWACLPQAGPPPAGQPARGSCVIEASRAFSFGDGWAPGANLVEPKRLTLEAGGEGALKVVPAR